MKRYITKVLNYNAADLARRLNPTKATKNAVEIAWNSLYNDLLADSIRHCHNQKKLDRIMEFLPIEMCMVFIELYNKFRKEISA